MKIGTLLLMLAALILIIKQRGTNTSMIIRIILWGLLLVVIGVSLIYLGQLIWSNKSY